MRSKIIGEIKFDETQLEKDINCIENFQFSDAYHEFRFGVWKTCILWNYSGQSDDDLIYEYKGFPKVTDLGKQLPYINQIIEDIFHLENIQVVRVVCSEKNGLILPHKDYLDLENGFTRIHIPLMIDENCLNSEGESVFNMRKGEIWYLEARITHSAGSFFNSKKYSLIIDFSPGIPIKQLFKNLDYYTTDIAPFYPERTPLEEHELESILNLKHLVNQANFMDIVGMLAKVPFFKKVTNESFFNWLEYITAGGNDPELIDRASEMKALFIEKKEELYKPV